MQLPQFTPDQTVVVDSEPFDEAAAQRRAMEMVEVALVDPVEGLAVLRASALLMAFLASCEEDPEKALAILIAERSGDAHACLYRMNSVPAGTA